MNPAQFTTSILPLILGINLTLPLIGMLFVSIAGYIFAPDFKLPVPK
jgi:hypothetical protein